MGTTPKRLEEILDRNGRVRVENTYVGGLVTQQRYPLGAAVPGATHGVYTFDYGDLGNGTVTVTDPVGTLHEYVFDPANGAVLLKKIVHKNDSLRSAVAGYDWSESPDEVADCYDYDLKNLMVQKSWREAKSGETWQKVTPYTWRFYDSGTQTTADVDPRRFGNLRVLRRDKSLGDDARARDALRESWSYTEDFNKVQYHWESRAWIGRPSSKEEPESWGSWNTSLDSAYKTAYSYSPEGDLLEILHPTVNVPTVQEDIRRTFTYNAYGQRLSDEDPSGVLVQYEYHDTVLDEGLLERRWTDVPGTGDPSERYLYDAYGRMVTRIDGNGRSWQFSYDGLDRVVTEKKPYLSPFGILETVYVYDGEDLVETQVPNRSDTGEIPEDEPAVIKTVSVYDPVSGVLLSEQSDVRTTGDAETNYTYDALLRSVRTEEELEEGNYRVSDDVYDELGRSIRSVQYLSDPDGAGATLDDDMVTDTFYDAAGNARLVRRQVGLDQGVMQYLETRYEYDRLGRLVRTYSPDGTVKETEYHDAALVSAAASTSHTYVTVVDEDPQTPDEMEETSRSEHFVDELGRTYRRRVWYDLRPQERYYDTETWYNKAGRMTRRYDQYTGQGETAPYYSWSYDAAGRREVYTTPNDALREEYTYDGNSNVTLTEVWEKRDDGGSGTTEYHSVSQYYNSWDMLYRTKYRIWDEEEEEFTYQYRRYYPDSQGRTRRDTFSSLGVETRTQYDLAGNVLKAERKISDEGEDGRWETTEFGTDYAGRVIWIKTQHPGIEDAYVARVSLHDAWGRLLCRSVPVAIAEGQEASSISCESLLSTQKHTYLYDLAGRVTTETDPNGTTKSYLYDENPDNSQDWRRGVLRRVDVTLADGVQGPDQIAYEYAAPGGCGCAQGSKPTRITTLQNGTPQTIVEREFNALGQVTLETLTLGANAYTVSYGYDSNNSVTESVTYEGGRTLRRYLDENGRIDFLESDVFSDEAGAFEEIASYGYQGTHKVSHRSYVHGGLQLENLADYDAAGFGRQRANTWDGGAVHYDWAARYDLANRRVEKKTGGYEPFKYTFEHDLRGKLVDIVNDSPNQLGYPGQSYNRSRTVYNWSSAGVTTGSTQCFVKLEGSNGVEVCEDAGGQSAAYVLARDARGCIQSVEGEHTLWYYDDALANRGGSVGPQARSTDDNGNMTQIGSATAPLVYTVENLPAEPDSVNEEVIEPQVWSFHYDAWNRLVEAERVVTDGTAYETPQVQYTFSYSNTYQFVYDGLGRRVGTDITFDNQDAHGHCPEIAGSFANIYDSSGRMIQRVDRSGAGADITYLHGPDAFPAMAEFRSAAVGKPQFYMTDVTGNVGATASGANPYALVINEERSEDDCGQVDFRPSWQEGGPLAHDAYASHYGYSEDGLRLVNNIYYTAWTIQSNGQLRDAETEKSGYLTVVAISKYCVRIYLRLPSRGGSSKKGNYGHAAFSLTRKWKDAWGFYPMEELGPSDVLRDVKGKLLKEKGKIPGKGKDMDIFECCSMKANAERVVKARRDKLRRKPGKYNPTKRNCTHIVRWVFAGQGFGVPKATPGFAKGDDFVLHLKRHLKKAPQCKLVGSVEYDGPGSS